MQSILFSIIFSFISALVYSSPILDPFSPSNEGQQSLIQTDNYICFTRNNLEQNETLEIIFSSPGGKAIWLADGPKPLDIKGSVITNGQLEICSPSGLILENSSSISSLGLKILCDKSISYRGSIAANSCNVYFISPKIELLGNAKINTSGDGLGGSVYIGGGWHGDDSSIPNADTVLIEADVTIVTDALSDGRGGDVVIWSDSKTTFHGQISARGISGGGDVEVSSAKFLIFDGFVDASSQNGKQGTLLIDPATIVIQASNPDIDGLGMGHDITSANELSNPAIFPGVNSIITSGAVEALLTGGVSMTLSATNSITVNSPISASGSVTNLTLNAPTLFLNQPIDLPFGGALDGTASVVNVGPSGDIQNGVDAVSSGGTVNLAAATYVQEVFIGKNLTLNGSGIDNTTIVCPTTPTPLTNTFIYTINGGTYHPIILAEGASNIIIQNLTVDGNSQPSNFLSYRFVGIGYHNAGGTIQNTHVTNIEDSFPGGQTQDGLAILGAIDTGSDMIQVLNNTIDRFQKQAITLRGPTLTTLVSGNTVIGETPPSQADMNGIVIEEGTLATVINNTVSNILSANPGVASVGIGLIDAAPNTTVSNNTTTNVNIGIYSIGAGNNLNISQNTVDVVTMMGIYVQDTSGLTTLSSNDISCNMTSSNSSGMMVMDPDTGAPMGNTFIVATPTYNMYLISSTNQPFALNTNQFFVCDIGLGVEGTGSLGPQVTMNHDSFIGLPTYYIQLINDPNNIWTSTATVSFNGLVSGFITFEQYLEIQSRLQGNFQSGSLGIILEFLQPFTPATPTNFIGKIGKNKFLNQTEYYLTATWTSSTSPNVIAYNIYFKGKFVKQIPASSQNIFVACLKSKKQASLYSITALNSMNLESPPIPITIVGH